MLVFLERRRQRLDLKKKHSKKMEERKRKGFYLFSGFRFGLSLMLIVESSTDSCWIRIRSVWYKSNLDVVDFVLLETFVDFVLPEIFVHNVHIFFC